MKAFKGCRSAARPTELFELHNSRAGHGLLASLLWFGAALIAMPLTAQTVQLGTAEGFAVLSGSAISNTGATVVTGQLGLSPGNASSVTGFPPGQVIGATHFADAVALTAQNNATTAYNDLAGRSCGTTISADLGGSTLTPGVYCSASSMGLTGTLTLDAQGDPNAIFVFQIGSTLTTASNAVVTVINGGQSCNVFWQVGSSATLGTGTNFAGSVVALSSITLNTGASASGRVLARNGAVTLDGNTVSLCTLAGTLPIDNRSIPVLSNIVGLLFVLTILAIGLVAVRRFT